MSFTAKKFYHKIYNSSGTYLTTWSSEVMNDPTFKMIMNSGQGEMRIQLARPINSYGEDVDVKFNNEVRTYVIDKENPTGLLLYSGYISDYQPMVDETSEYIEVTVLGFVVELENTVLVDSNGNTAKVYTGEDPSDIIADILSLYNALGGRVTAGTIDATGTTRDYNFNGSTNQQAIDKCREISPIGWYWFVGADKKLNFKNKSVTADHTFIIGKHLTKMEAFKTMRDLKNVVRFIGGVPSGSPQLYKYYSDSTSISNYGRREYVMIDQRVISSDTADAMANAFLDANKYPFVRATVTILDSNGDDQNFGYDIESIKPGDTCKIIDPKAPAGIQTYALNQVMIIQTVQYDYDTVTLELSIRAPWVAKRIQDIYRDLNKSVLADVPPYPVGAVGGTFPSIFGNVTIGDPNQPNQLTIYDGKQDLYDQAGKKTIDSGVVNYSYVSAHMVAIIAVASDTDVAIGEGKLGIAIPSLLNNYNLISALASVYVKGITGSTTIQIRKSRGGVDSDMLHTLISIGNVFYASSSDVDLTKNNVQTGDLIFIDVDTVHSGTKAKGLSVVMTFQINNVYFSTLAGKINTSH